MGHEGSIFTPSLRGVKIVPECPIFSRMDSSPVEYGTLFHSSHNCSAFECVLTLFQRVGELSPLQARGVLLRKLFIFYIKRKSKPSHVKIGLGLSFYWKNSRFHCFHAPQKCPTPIEFDDLSTVSTLNLPQILSRKWKSWWKTIHFLKANYSRKLK